MSLMSHIHQVRDLIMWWTHFERSTGTAPEWQHLEDDEAFLDTLTGVELGDCLAEAERIIRAGRAVKSHIEDYLAADITENGAIRLGADGYYIGPATTRRVIDPLGLLHFLYNYGDLYAIEKAININSGARIGVIRGYGGESSDAVVDSFFEETKQETKLRKVPAMKSKWVKNLEHGERRA
ncbi:hypothetical protein LCGC14_0397110 [marine sediment metagenome]|uniref:Uncharacterized protein n=1 Tax=marine sediment metagenome TaxID=412755 RepID=A0A0F9W6X3_9ZZZZ